MKECGVVLMLPGSDQGKRQGQTDFRGCRGPGGPSPNTSGKLQSLC